MNRYTRQALTPDLASPVQYTDGTDGAVCLEHLYAASDSPAVDLIRNHEDDLVMGVCDWCRAELEAAMGQEEPCE